MRAEDFYGEFFGSVAEAMDDEEMNCVLGDSAVRFFSDICSTIEARGCKSERACIGVVLEKNSTYNVFVDMVNGSLGYQVMQKDGILSLMKSALVREGADDLVALFDNPPDSRMVAWRA